MATPDPTADLIRSLADPTRWHVTRGVVAFKAHRRTFRDGDEITVTDADLDRFARDAQAAVEAGRPLALTVGHVKYAADARETDQPPLAGFMVNWRTGPVLRNGKPVKVVLYDEYLFPDAAAGVLRQYPYRSVDVVVEPGRPFPVIKGGACLVRPPALDMGAVVGGARHYHYSAEIDMAGEAETFTDDEARQYQFFARCMKRYMAEVAATTADLPKPGQKKYEGEFEQFEQRLQAAESKAAETEKQLAREKAGRLLDKAVKVIKFDYNAELDRLTALPDDAARDKHLAYMLDHYEKLPTGGFIPIARDVTGGGRGKADAPLTEAEFGKARQYQAENAGKSWEEAMAHVKGQRK